MVRAVRALVRVLGPPAVFSRNLSLVYMLHEKPEDLIRSSIESFEIEPDLVTLGRIDGAIAKATQERSRQLDALNERVALAAQEVERLQQELDDVQKPPPELEGDNIFKAMNNKSMELDNAKVAVAKKLNEVESAINTLTITKINLEKQQQQLITTNENLMAEVVATNFDSKAMEINLYKNLGVLIDGQRVVIHNRDKDVTSVLNVSEDYSDYFVSNYIWDKLPGET